LSLVIDLSASCGRHFQYRDLVECGKTWTEAAAAGRPIDNLPRHPDTLTALGALVVHILDPLVDEFGALELTYGFASQRLTRAIKRRIAPPLDQHAAHETNSEGRPICPRLGAAADIRIPTKAASEVARWIRERLPFDRLYLFGDDRPIHVSYGPDHKRDAIEMRPGPSGRLIPRRLR